MGLFPKRVTTLSISLLLLLIGLTGCLSEDGLIWPNEPSPTPIGTILPPPVPVNFETLNAEPLVFRNKVIEVEGIFSPANPSSCIPFKGPVIDWHIIAENLEMDVSGLGEVSGLIPERARIKVEGVWRLYDGPLGCGKEPERGFAWYLEAIRIVEPNPLAFAPSGALVVQEGVTSGQENNVQGGNPTPTETTNVQPTSTATEFILPTQVSNTPTAQATATAGMTPTLQRTIPTETPTRISGVTATPVATSSPTVGPTGTPETSTPTSGSATPTPTDSDDSGSVPLPQSTTNPTEYEGPGYP